jgi:HAD domain in Swiss Army Knife RNA repair proteins
MKNKYLFLDFDGVLHPSMCDESKKLCQAPFLAGLISEFPCKIIISSSWRFQHPIDEIKKMLPKVIANCVIGATGDALDGPYQRFNEIKLYLQVHGKTLADWKALDDSMEFPDDCNNLIKCNFRTGIESSQLMELKKWLQN